MLKKALLTLAGIGLLFGSAIASANVGVGGGYHKCNVCGKITWTKGPCPMIACPPKHITNPGPNPTPTPTPKPKPGPIPVPQKNK